MGSPYGDAMADLSKPRQVAQHVEEVVSWAQYTLPYLPHASGYEMVSESAQWWVDRWDDQWHAGEDPVLRDMRRALLRHGIPFPDDASFEEIRSRYKQFRGIE